MTTKVTNLIQEMTKKLQGKGVYDYARDKLTPYLKQTDVDDPSKLAYDPEKLWQGLKSGELDKNFLDAYFGKETITGLETAFAEQESYNAGLEQLQPYYDESSGGYRIRDAFTGGVPLDTLKTYFGEEVQDILSAFPTSEELQQSAEINNLLNPQVTLTPEFETDTLPTLPQELKDVYSQYKAGETTLDDFTSLYETWKTVQREELINLVTEVYPGFLEAPEDKLSGVVNNFLNTLATDTATQQAFTTRLKELGRNETTESLIATLMPEANERDIKQIFGEDVTPLSELTIGSYDISQQSINDIYELGETDPEKLRLAFVSEGRNAQTEALVKELYRDAATDDFIDKYFSDIETDRRRIIEDVYFTHLPPGITRESLMEKYSKDYPKDIAEELTNQEMDNYQMFSNEAIAEFWITEPTEKAISAWYQKQKGIPIGAQLNQYMQWRTGQSTAEPTLFEQFGAGWGDTLKSLTSGLKWMGLPENFVVVPFTSIDLNELEKWGTSAQQIAPTTKGLLSQMVRSIPFSVSLIPFTIVGATGGEAVASVLGLGKVATWLLSSLGSVAVERPLESLMEVGSSYDDLVAQFGKAEADKKALGIFEKNMALSGADAFEIALALAPMPKGWDNIIKTSKLLQTVKVGGKVVVVGLSQAGEEFVQNVFTRQAFGQEIKWDDEMKAAVIVGGLMGTIMGVSGDVISSLNDRVKTKLTPQMQTRLNELVEEAKSQGLTDDLATLQAVEALSNENKKAAEIFQNVIKEIQPAKKTISAKEQEQIKAVLDTTEGKDIISLTEKTGWNNGLYEDIPAGVYKELTGQDAKPSQLTGDLKNVKANDALKMLAKQYGYASVEEFKVAVNNISNAKMKNEAMQAETTIPSRKLTPKQQEQVRIAEQSVNTEIQGIIDQSKGDNEIAITQLQTELDKMNSELKARNTPYHARMKNAYPKITTLELDVRANKYQDALNKLKQPPQPTPVAPTIGKEAPAVTDEYSFKEEETATPTRPIQQRIQFEEGKRSFTEKFTKGYQTFQVKMIDDLYHLQRFEQIFIKAGIELNIEERPYYLARLLRGVMGKANVFISEGTFGKKFWKMENGKARMNFTGESLENILKEVSEPQQWMDFATYLTARRAFDLSLRDIQTGISQEQSAAEIALYEDKYPNFRDLAERVYKYQDNLLVYGQEMGLLSKDMLEKLRRYGSYVPFYRVFEELESRGYMGKQLANVQNPIKRIKGSERDIINPLESIVKNTYVIINSAERNQVGIMMANLVNKYPDLSDTFERVKTPIARVAQVSAKELGVEIEGLSDTDAEAVVDIFRPSFYTKGDEVTVLVDGKKQYYRVDQDLKDALLNLDREDLGMLGRFLSMPAKWLRAGATLSPDFMFRNPVRDQLTAFTYSNYGFIPGVDFLRGLASLFSKDEYYTLFHASGAEHSMMVSMDREYLRKTFKELVNGKGITNYIKHPLELLQIISAAGEKATRLGEFKAGIKRGATPMQSGYSSRSVTLDFSQAGTTAYALNRIAAFFNANVRGWGKMLSSFKEHPIRTTAKVFLGITLPSILLYMINRDDDRWKEIPQYQKDLFWIVFIGDNIYRIPKPFELGIIFGSMPERFLEWMDTKDPDMMKDSALQLINSGFPNPIPTAAEPIIEWITNYSFFKGRNLVSEGKKGLPAELQYTIYTSEVSKKLGEWLNMSPIKIDNTLSGYTAGLGNYAIDILDGIMKKTGISPDIPLPTPTLSDIPVIKAFVVRNPYGSSGESVNNFYNKLEEYESGEQYLKKMLENNNQSEFEKYKAEHPELLFFYEFPTDPDRDGVFYSASARYLRRVGSELSELGKKQEEIYKSPTITPDEKRRLIDEIDLLKTELTSKALTLLEGSNVLQSQVDALIAKLGTIRDDVPILSLENPDIYTMKNLHTEFSNLLEVVKPEDIKGMEGLDQLAVSFASVKQVENTVDVILNKKIYEIKPDLKEGFTFTDYYQSWKQRLIKDESLDSISRREAELLNEYNQLDKAGKAQFLKDNPELTVNPRTEWLKSHPAENALLAVWGQAKILTKEAYTEFQNLVKMLDIPDSALPERTLPPDESIDGYFRYLDEVENRSAGSWEAQLIIAQDDKLREFLDREPIETPQEALELKIKHRDLYDLKDSYSDKDSANYIDSSKDRADAIAELYADNPDWIDDMRRVEAIENNGLDYQEQWVDRGHIIDGDKIGSADRAGSSEAKVWLLDNPDIFQWALDNELLTDDGSDWNEPVLRINARWREQDNEYNDIDPDAKNPDTGISLRDEYLAGNEEYRQDRRRRDAYQLKDKDGNTFPIEQIDNYVAYYELPEKGKRRDRFLIDNPDFAQAMHTIAGIDLPEKVPNIAYDDIYDQYRQEFERLEGLGDNKSDFYIENVDARDKARQEMRFKDDGTLTDFGIAEIRRKAYGDYIPDEYIDRYVDYYKILNEGTPQNWPTDKSGNKLTWYEDDWYLIEHPEFYEKVYLGLMELEKRDFSIVPTRAVFDKYVEYSNLITGKPRDDFRWDEYKNNGKDFENWLLATGKVTTPIWEKKRREELTPKERVREEMQDMIDRLRG